MAAYAERICIRGRVQGVGFRPHVWRMANELGIRGSVRNASSGVLIDAWADLPVIERFLRQLHARLPPLAKIEAIEREAVQNAVPPIGFDIIVSTSGVVTTPVPADVATCPECLVDVFDSVNRRFHYPFTNCVHCGPRFSIVNAMPWDRANTSMAGFHMCGECLAEYHDPTNRRFHAQANACPECGPQIWLETSNGQRIDGDDVIAHAVQQIGAGRIVAIKGVGGFHLACDASNDEAVTRLRRRKRRLHKPLALLAKNLDMVRRYASVNGKEARLLTGIEAPIILLRAQGMRLATGIAPAQHSLGFALPSSALHHLLMHLLDAPLVFTSGNGSNEPQCIDNQEARNQLASIADCFLCHDRAIVNRLDDSVARIVDGRRQMIRHGRGYAPSTVTLPKGFESAPPVLAMGPELKNTFCLTKNGRAIVSQYIGDLESAPALKEYRRQLQSYQSLYEHQPQLIAVDKHPNYLSTQAGHDIATQLGVECLEVQHHHAHIAAVMVEHGLPLNGEPVLGITLDGLGLGDDGTLWGGEFLLANYAAYTRLSHFEPVPMLGAAQAIREPWRNTLAHLLNCFDWRELQALYGDLGIVRFLQSKPVSTFQHMAEHQLNSPLTSSCGRLFDAVAAVLGVCRDEVSYEGQAAIELEALAETAFDKNTHGYPVDIGEGCVVRWRPLWLAVLDDLKNGVNKGTIAARFHRGVIDSLVQVAVGVCQAERVRRVVLSGGVFQNRLLLQGVTPALVRQGCEVLVSHCVPMSDGGVSLGQAAIAIARQKAIKKASNRKPF